MCRGLPAFRPWNCPHTCCRWHGSKCPLRYAHLEHKNLRNGRRYGKSKYLCHAACRPSSHLRICHRWHIQKFLYRPGHHFSIPHHIWNRHSRSMFLCRLSCHSSTSLHTWNRSSRYTFPGLRVCHSPSRPHKYHHCNNTWFLSHAGNPETTCRHNGCYS